MSHVDVTIKNENSRCTPPPLNTWSLTTPSPGHLCAFSFLLLVFSATVLARTWEDNFVTSYQWIFLDLWMTLLLQYHARIQLCLVSVAYFPTVFAKITALERIIEKAHKYMAYGFWNPINSTWKMSKSTCWHALIYNLTKACIRKMDSDCVQKGMHVVDVWVMHNRVDRPKSNLYQFRRDTCIPSCYYHKLSIITSKLVTWRTTVNLWFSDITSYICIVLNFV